MTSVQYNKYTANSFCKHQSVTTATNTVESSATNWKDVSNTIKQMDQSYDATFYAWLKSEENVLVTSIYLHRIANEYTLDRISNALEWLTMDWRWENVLMVVQHMTIDWSDEGIEVIMMASFFLLERLKSFFIR